ncbi:MAG: type IV pilus modification protein PilV [Lysobacterales bacterium]
MIRPIFLAQRAPRIRPSTQGFSLIEVLVALLVLGFGLLGLAMLQNVALRNSQSANHRTVATNLAYEVIDMARANRRLAFRFGYIDAGEFSSVSATTCDMTPNTGDRVGDDVNSWKCHVRRALPNGEADIVITPGANGGVMQVSIRWDDARWLAAGAQAETFVVQSVI